MASSYQLGSLLNITCSSKPGHPPPTLTWSINSTKMNPRAFSYFTLPNGLTVSTSVLTLLLASPKMPIKMLVKCSATIEQFYNQHTVARIKLVKPDKPRMGEPLLSYSHQACSSLKAFVVMVTLFANDSWWGDRVILLMLVLVEKKLC